MKIKQHPIFLFSKRTWKLGVHLIFLFLKNMKIERSPNCPLLEKLFFLWLEHWGKSNNRKIFLFKIAHENWVVVWFSSTKNIFKFFFSSPENLRKSGSHQIVMLFWEKECPLQKINFIFVFFFWLLKIIKWLPNSLLQKKFKFFFSWPKLLGESSDHQIFFFPKEHKIEQLLDFPLL